MARSRKNNVVTMPNPDANRSTRSGPSTISDQDVARRAYEIYERRGGTDGAALDDWLQAERDLLASPPTQRRA